MLLEPLPLETTRESPSFKLEPMETERSPGPRLQELLGPSPKRDPQAVKERGEEQLSGQVGGERGCGYPAVRRWSSVAKVRECLTSGFPDVE